MVVEERRRARWIRRVLAAGFVTTVSLLALRTSVGFAIAPISPAVASIIAPGLSEVHAVQARQLLQGVQRPADLPPIVVEAKRAVIAAPLDHASARTIAMIDIAESRAVRGNRIMELVGAATLRDALAHAWLLNRAYEQSRWSDVASEANIVMRLDPSMRSTGFAMLNTLVEDGRVLPQLARVLESRPPWRSGFLVNMGENSRSPANERGLLLLLRASSAPPTAQELRTWFLVNSDRQSGAALLANYRALAPQDFLASERYVRNGNFEGTQAFPPYDWFFYAPDGGAAEITASPDGIGRTLYVEFSGRNQMGVAVQRLSLPAGRYRLRLRTYALTAMAEDAVGMSLSCGATATMPNPPRMPLRGNVNEWRVQTFTVDVAPGCSGPSLTVDWRPGANIEPTQLYIDDLSVAPLTATRSTPSQTSRVTSPQQ